MYFKVHDTACECGSVCVNMNENGYTLSVNVSSFVPLSMMGYFKGPVGCVDSLLCLRMSAVEVKPNWLGCWMNGELILCLCHCTGTAQ